MVRDQPPYTSACIHKQVGVSLLQKDTCSKQIYKQAENLKCNTFAAQDLTKHILVQNRSPVTNTGSIYSGYDHCMVVGDKKERESFD